MLAKVLVLLVLKTTDHVATVKSSELLTEATQSVDALIATVFGKQLTYINTGGATMIVIDAEIPRCEESPE